MRSREALRHWIPDFSLNIVAPTLTVQQPVDSQLVGAHDAGCVAATDTNGFRKEKVSERRRAGIDLPLLWADRSLRLDLGHRGAQRSTEEHSIYQRNGFEQSVAGQMKQTLY